MSCDDVLLHVLQHGALPPDGDAHLAGCPHCAADVPALLSTARDLVAVPSPSPALRARVLVAAAPLLAARAHRPAWAQVARAMAVALPALPLVVLANVWIVRTLHVLLASVLPESLSMLIAGQYALLAALLVTLGYAAVPLVAANQHRLEEHHVRA